MKYRLPPKQWDIAWEQVKASCCHRPRSVAKGDNDSLKKSASIANKKKQAERCCFGCCRLFKENGESAHAS